MEIGKSTINHRPSQEHGLPIWVNDGIAFYLIGKVLCTITTVMDYGYHIQSEIVSWAQV